MPHARTGEALALAALERKLAAAPRDSSCWIEALRLLGSGRIPDELVGISLPLDGARPLRVAVVSAYFEEDLPTLVRCHRSVITQTYPCHHILVSDGRPNDQIDRWNAIHLRVTGPSRDFGDTPRALGGLHASEHGYDAVAYLDADNSYRPRHIESLVASCIGSGASVGWACRTLHLPDGRLIPSIMQDDLVGHIDTSCLFLTRAAYAMLDAWLCYPRALSAVGDRLVVQMARQKGLAFAASGAFTVRYTVRSPFSTESAGWSRPPRRATGSTAQRCAPGFLPWTPPPGWHWTEGWDSMQVRTYRKCSSGSAIRSVDRDYFFCRASRAALRSSLAFLTEGRSNAIFW